MDDPKSLKAAAAILAGTALIGNWLLATLGITIPAFRIAGGLLLFAVASEMVGLSEEVFGRTVT